jgi:hypothetical protein
LEDNEASVTGNCRIRPKSIAHRAGRRVNHYISLLEHYWTRRNINSTGTQDQSGTQNTRDSGNRTTSPAPFGHLAPHLIDSSTRILAGKLPPSANQWINPSSI